VKEKKHEETALSLNLGALESARDAFFIFWSHMMENPSSIDGFFPH